MFNVLSKFRIQIFRANCMLSKGGEQSGSVARLHSVFNWAFCAEGRSFSVKYRSVQTLNLEWVVSRSSFPFICCSWLGYQSLLVAFSNDQKEYLGKNSLVFHSDNESGIQAIVSPSNSSKKNIKHKNFLNCYYETFVAWKHLQIKRTFMRFFLTTLKTLVKLSILGFYFLRGREVSAQAVKYTSILTTYTSIRSMHFSQENSVKWQYDMIMDQFLSLQWLLHSIVEHYLASQW